MLSSISRQVPRVLRRPLACSLRARCFASEADGLPSVNLTFGSPNELFYNGVGIKQVDVSTSTGSFGILPNHVPSLASLKPGVVTVFDHEGKTSKFFASSGTVTINSDSTVQILAEEAVPLERLDPQTTNQQLEQAQLDLSNAASDVDKAKAAVAVECLQAMVKALQH